VFEAAEGAERAGVEFYGFDGLGEFEFGHGVILCVYIKAVGGVLFEPGYDGLGSSPWVARVASEWGFDERPGERELRREIIASFAVLFVLHPFLMKCNYFGHSGFPLTEVGEINRPIGRSFDIGHLDQTANGYIFTLRWWPTCSEYFKP